MSKLLKYLVVHCTATPQGMTVTRQDIIKWHKVERGWSRLGYSDMIHQNGHLENLTPFNQDNWVDDHEKTWGVAGINSAARHVVYVGGGDGKDTRTSKQKESLATYIRYMVLRHPDIQVAGHNQFSNKACPSFDVPDFCRKILVPHKNIYYGSMANV